MVHLPHNMKDAILRRVKGSTAITLNRPRSCTFDMAKLLVAFKPRTAPGQRFMLGPGSLLRRPFRSKVGR